MAVFPSLRLCVSAVIIFLFISATLAQRRALGWTWQNPLPQGNPLYSIHFAPDKETGFAVGSDGTIIRTVDGGFSWIKQTPPVDVTFSAVFVRDKNNVLVVGSRGTILSTINGGKEWKQVAVDTRDHLYSIKFAGADLKTGWITGTYGRILKTMDGGFNWKSQNSGTTKQLLKHRRR